MKPGRLVHVMTALITGASGGIGLELARLFAADGSDVVLVARSEDKLRALAEEINRDHGVTAHVYPADLAEPGASGRICDELASAGVQIDALVNNAGFALFGPLVALDEAKLDELLQVNIVALTDLTRRLLPGMLERGLGYVLNVASTAAFFPGPSMASYYASKAYVLNFSIAVNEEVRGTGVSVTALCPGPVQTGFQARAEMGGSKLFNARMSSAAEVAAFGYRAMKARKPLAVEGSRNKVIAFLSRLGPRPLAAQVTMRAHARREG